MSVKGYARSVFRAPGQHIFRNGPRARFGLYGSGFTLVELLVVIAVIAILAAILFPVFASAQQSGRRARCSVQLKQLAAAAIAYADDNNGRYVPAAMDIDGENTWRWHGYRSPGAASFDPRRGPLWPYLGRSGGLKVCPEAPNLRRSFEAGCGGFGYNAQYVGGTYYRNERPIACQVASLTSDIAQPSRTLMFADTAVADNPNSNLASEYSFAEPPYTVTTSGPAYRTGTPTIQFRHSGRTNVAWCDGHVGSRSMEFTRAKANVYRCSSEAYSLGWFGADDNTLFDNK